jgi:hypothetical protein
MKQIKKIIVAVAIIAGILILAVADAKLGESQCGEGKYNQTTGECIAD